MKKVATFLLIIFATLAASGQKYKDAPKYAFVAVAVDGRHLVEGSPASGGKPSLDLILQVGAVYKGFEVGVEYESHTALTPDFKRYGFFVNYGFETLENVYLYSGVSYGIISREGNSAFQSIGLNGEIRYDSGGRFTVGLVANLQQRHDLLFYYGDAGVWRASGFIKVQFKLN